MGFLDNSGDIILDAVLTDHGRKVLARGDGSFSIKKFALGDEEIDYTLYDSSNQNGSAYYDLEILQTPVLEAFTDNAISMKSRLVTYEDMNLLYLPVMLLNESETGHQMHSDGAFIVAVDGMTENDNGTGTTTNGIGFDSNGKAVTGVLRGFTPRSGGGLIKIDQGFNTTALSYGSPIEEQYYESEYTVQIDNRLGRIMDPQGNEISYDYVDDDNIAYYQLTADDAAVMRNTNVTDAAGGASSEVIRGPRGSTLMMKIGSSLNLRTSTYLFTEIGSEKNMTNTGGTNSTVYYIDTIVRVTGNNSGYSVDLPVRFVKFKQLA